jgi:hypothetical protein
MKRTFRKVLAILDGTPTGMRGQSLVELSVTMPILLIMLLGMVEIGWLANNYLTLIDVTREAGRYGSVRDPVLQWTPGYEVTYNWMDCDTRDNTFDKLPNELRTTYPGPSIPGFSNGIEGTQLGYYDGVACAVLTNMVPLQFDDQTDDIVVSVFSYAPFPDAGSPAGTRIRVVGRYPTGSNECPSDSDPFNPSYYTATPPGWDATTGAQEGRRGYFFRGNHSPSAGCLGSEFTTQEIEDMLNTTVLDDSGGAITANEITHVPSGGIILVEVFWNSRPLLGVPFFNIIGEELDLHVWSLFPNTAAEPACNLLNGADC